MKDLHHRPLSRRNSLVSDLNFNGADVRIFHKILLETNSNDGKVLFKFISIVSK